MTNLLRTLFKLIQSLFGGTSSPDQQSDTVPSADSTEEHCAIYNVEIPSPVDLTTIPYYRASTVNPPETTAQAVYISCYIQIRPSLGRVNIRVGPRLNFGPIAQTEGGNYFELQGASEADPDGYRWYMITTPVGAGWVRGDMVIIGEDCLPFTFIDEDDLTPPETDIPSPTGRFPLPADVRITQHYSSSHRAYDLLTEYGTVIKASAPGIVIRRLNCTACEASAFPFRYPCPSWMLQDETWGYGYGNTVTLRHNYSDMPPAMRDHMDSKGLKHGFVYILYAHFSENRVAQGEVVKAGQVIGLTGNHGCSSSPHLHFEVRMGRDETIDGHWIDQTPVNPNLVFAV